MDSIEIGTEANFADLVEASNVPVLVDFWAPWCGPCRLVGPILNEVADEYAGRAKIVKVNVDEEQGLAASMGIRSIPTLALYHNGEVVETVVGARPKDDLTALLDKALAN
jgi:thioredoxin 1